MVQVGDQTWDGEVSTRTPASPRAAYLDGLRLQAVIGKWRAKFKVMGFPITLRPINPIFIPVEPIVRERCGYKLR